MKKIISFLCKMPGILLMTALILGTSMYLRRENLDERWWIAVILNTSITMFTATYFSFLLSPNVGSAKSIPLILISILTGLAITITTLLWSKTEIEFRTDYAIQCSTFESMAGILIWAWFALFWNYIHGAKKAEEKKSAPPYYVPDDFG